MTSYAFKEWLTFDEAAAWLTDATGTPYDKEAISRAAENDRLPVHYWPTDDAHIGLYRLKLLPGSGDVVESPLNLDSDACEVLCLIDGPVPVRLYRLFKSAAQMLAHGRPVGLSASLGPDGLYGCYRIGENDRPLSIMQGNYEILIHLADLERLKNNLPMPTSAPPHDFIFTEGTFPALEQTLCLARSAVNWSSYPNAEPPIPEFVAESERRPEPLLRALGLAAHLIAELGGELDQNEQLVSRRRRYTRGGSPNITTISKALANTATKLRHDGHNFQGAGFEKLLRQALKEIE